MVAVKQLMAKSQAERQVGAEVLFGTETGAEIEAEAEAEVEVGAGTEPEAEAEAESGAEPKAQVGAQILSLLCPQAQFPFPEHWNSLSQEKEIYILYLAQLQIPFLAPILY